MQSLVHIAVYQEKWQMQISKGMYRLTHLDHTPTRRTERKVLSLD